VTREKKEQANQDAAYQSAKKSIAAVKTNFKMNLGLNASRPGEKLPLIKSKETPELDKNFLQRCSTGIKRNRGQWVWDCQYMIIRDVGDGSILRLFPFMMRDVAGGSKSRLILDMLPHGIDKENPSANPLKEGMTLYSDMPGYQAPHGGTIPPHILVTASLGFIRAHPRIAF